MSNLNPTLTSIYTAQKIIKSYKVSSNKKTTIYIHLAILAFFLCIGFTLYSRYNKKLKKKESIKENKLKMKKKLEWLHNKIKKDDLVRQEKENEELLQRTNKFFTPPHTNIPVLSYEQTYINTINLMDRIQKNRFNKKETLNPYQI